MRRVRTIEGSRFYNLPIGAPITKDVVDAAKAAAALKGIANAPKGALTRDKNKIPTVPTVQAKAPKHEGGGSISIVKSTISGPANFKVGKATYSAPDGSRLIRKKSDPSIAYVRTPDGEVHAFNEEGEVATLGPIQNALKAIVGKDELDTDVYDPADLHADGNDDESDQGLELHKLPENSEIRTPNGTVTFKKTKDGWQGSAPFDDLVLDDETAAQMLEDDESDWTAHPPEEKKPKPSEAGGGDGGKEKPPVAQKAPEPQPEKKPEPEKKPTPEPVAEKKPELSKENADKLAELQANLKKAQDENKKFAAKSIQSKIDALQGTEKAPEPQKTPTPETKMRDVEGEDIWDGEVASAEPGFGYRMHDLPQPQSYKKLGPNDWEHTDRFGKKSHATDAVVAKAWDVGGEGDHSWVPQVPADKKAEPKAPETPKAPEPQTSAFEVSGNPMWWETPAGTVSPKYQLGHQQREIWKNLTDEQRNVANTAMDSPDESTGKHYTTASAALKKAQAHVPEKKPEPKAAVPEAPKEPEAKPEPKAPEAPAADGHVDLDGDSVSKADIEAALKSMEEHSGFQIAYGLKSVPNNPLAKDKELQDRIKTKAMDAYPQLKPKPAMVKYLKEKLGIKKSDSKKETSGKKIKIGQSDNPIAKSVQGFNGGEFDAADVQEAVDLLEGFDGKAFKAHLNKHNNPLGVLNPNDIVGFEKDKKVAKQKFVDHLKDLLAKNGGAPDVTPEKKPDVTPEAPKVPKQRVKPEAPKAPEVPTQEEIEQLSDEDLFKLAEKINQAPPQEPLNWDEAFKDITHTPPQGWDGEVETAPAGASFESNFGQRLERVGPDEWQHYGKGDHGLPAPKDENTLTDAEAKAEMDSPNSGTWSPVDAPEPETPEQTWTGHPDSAYNGDAYVNSNGDKLVQTSFGKWELWDKDGNKVDGPFANDEVFIKTNGNDDWTPVEASVSNDELIAMESKPMPQKPLYTVNPDDEVILDSGELINKGQQLTHADQLDTLPDGAQVRITFGGYDGTSGTVATKMDGTWYTEGTDGSLKEYPKLYSDADIDKGRVHFEKMTDHVSKQADPYMGGLGSPPSDAPSPPPPKPDAVHAPPIESPNIPPPEHSPEVPDGPPPFHILPEGERGKNGDGWHKSGPWGKYGAAGVMIRSKNEKGEDVYLIAQRSKYLENDKLKWQLPGGAIDEHETPYQGAARELEEEIQGAEGKSAALVPKGEHVYDNGKGWQYTTLLSDSPEMFNASVPDGDFETAQVKWATAAEIAEMDANGELIPALTGGKLTAHVNNFAKSEDAPPVHAPEDAEEGDAIAAEDIGGLEQGSVIDTPAGAFTVMDDAGNLKSDTGITATSEALQQLAELAGEPSLTVGHVGDGEVTDPAPDLLPVNLDKALDGVDPNPGLKLVIPETAPPPIAPAAQKIVFGLDEAPVWTKKPTTVKQGTYEIHEYTDQFGNEYIFKPRDDGKKFRPYVETLANDLGRSWGFDSAESAVVNNVPGQPYGIMQKKLPATGDLHSTSFGTLTGDQIGDIASEHVLDWMLDNDDAKGDNVLVTPDGIVGIDKARAFNNYGHWQGLTPGYMNTNAHTVYSIMLNDIISGKISKEKADEAYLKMKDRIKKIQDSSMADVFKMVEDTMLNRPADMPYKVDYYVDGKKVPQDLDGLLQAIAHRRNQLDLDFDNLWQNTYTKAGHGDLPEIKTLGKSTTPASLEELSPEGMAPNVNAPEANASGVTLNTHPTDMPVGTKVKNEYGTVFTKGANNSWTSVAPTGAFSTWQDSDMVDFLDNKSAGWDLVSVGPETSAAAPNVAPSKWDGTVANAKSGDAFTSGDGSKLVNEGPGQWRILNPSGEDLGLVDQSIVETEVATGNWTTGNTNSPVAVPDSTWDGTIENAKPGNSFSNGMGYKVVNVGPENWAYKTPEDNTITSGLNNAEAKDAINFGQGWNPDGPVAPATQAGTWDGTVENSQVGHSYLSPYGESKLTRMGPDKWQLQKPDGSPYFVNSPDKFYDDETVKEMANTGTPADDWKPDLPSTQAGPWDGSVATAKVGDAYVSGTSGNRIQKFGDNEWHVMNSEGKDVTVEQGDVPFNDVDAEKTSKIDNWNPVPAAGDWNGDINALIEGGEWDGTVENAKVGNSFTNSNGGKYTKIEDDAWESVSAGGKKSPYVFSDDDVKSTIDNNPGFFTPDNATAPAAPKPWDGKKLSNAPEGTEIKNINSGVTFKKRTDGDWDATALNGDKWFAEDEYLQDDYDAGHIVPAAKADEIIKNKNIAAWSGKDAADAPVGATVQSNVLGASSALDKIGKSQWQAYNSDGTPAYTLEDFEIQHDLDIGALQKVAPGVGLPSGKYTKDGTKAYYLVSDDGKVRQVTSKGNVHDVDPAKASAKLASWEHTDSIDSFPEPGAKVDMGEPVSTTKKKKLANADLPAGNYKIGDKTLNVGSNGVISLNGIETTAAKIKTHYNQGKIHNDEGTSMLPDQYSGPLSIGHAAGSSAALPGVLAILEDPDFNAPLTGEGMKRLNEAGLKINPSSLFQVLKAKNPDALPPGSSYDYTWNDDNPVHPLAKEYLLSEIGKLTSKVDIDPPSAASSALFDWEDDKTATRPVSTYWSGNAYDLSAAETSAVAKKISAEFGNGKVLHVPSTHKSRKSWLAAFGDGEFKEMYKIESYDLGGKGKAHPGVLSHPGAPTNQATHEVNWASPVKGEISASKKIDGDWSTTSPHSWSNAEIDNYLIAAKMQNPEYLSVAERRAWVANHKAGHPKSVRDSSVIALQRKQSGVAPLTPAPTWTSTIVPAKSYSSVFDNGAPKGSDWNNLQIQASQDWAKDNWNDPDFSKYLVDTNSSIKPSDLSSSSWSSQKKVQDEVKAYWDKRHADHLAEINKPVYSKTKQIGGGDSNTWLIEDQFGRKKIHKEVPAGKEDLADRELAGTTLGRSWGYATPSMTKGTPAGEHGLSEGLVIDHVESTGTLLDGDGKPLNLPDLSTAQVGQLGSEHVLDWMLDNDGAHADNFLVDTNGRLVGTNKEQAFSHYGAWDGLNPNATSSTGHPPVYEDLWNKIRNGELSQEQANEAYKQARRSALRIQKSSDADVEAQVRAAVAGRTDWTLPGGSSHVGQQNVPNSADELVAKVLDRKNSLANDIEKMWAKVFEASPYDKPEIPNKLLGDDHVSGWDEPDLIDTVHSKKAYSQAVMLSGKGIVDGQSKFWSEKLEDGTIRVRGRMFIDSFLQKSVLDHLQSKTGTAGSAGPEDVSGFPDLTSWKNTIKDAARDGNDHVGDQAFDDSLWKKMTDLEDTMTRDRVAWAPTVAASSGKLSVDADGLVTFPSGNKVPENLLPQYQQGLDHYIKLALNAHDGKDDGKTVSLYDYTFKPVPGVKGKKFVSPDGQSSIQKQSVYGDSWIESGPNGVTKYPGGRPAHTSSWVKENTGTAGSDGAVYDQVNAYDYEGELLPDGTKLTSSRILGGKGGTGDHTEGQDGTQFEITLPDGEEIWFRDGGVTETSLTQSGTLQYSLKPGDEQASLQRVKNKLSEMGVNFEGATEDDVETEYWRTSFRKVVGSKYGSSKIKAARDKLTAMYPDVVKDLQAKGIERLDDGSSSYYGKEANKYVIDAIHQSMTPQEEAKFWKDLAYETWGHKRVDDWVASGRHMPQYQKMDMNEPDLTHGVANFERIDVADDIDEAKKKGIMLAVSNKYKDDSLLKQVFSGGMLSTENRLRILGKHVAGASSSDDQRSGGGNSIFTRLSKPGANNEFTGNLYGAHGSYWNLDALKFNGTYSFDDDYYGRKAYQSEKTPYDLAHAFDNFTETGNETMIPEALSIFEFLEIMVFDSQSNRQKAIDQMKQRGYATLRGIPIEERFVMRNDLKKAMAKVRAQWK